MQAKQITIFTDGSSRGNPGPGGWAAILLFSNTAGHIEKVREIGGREDHTTNNRMELMAAIGALKFLSDKSEIDAASSADEIIVKPDSEYVVKGMNEWISGWVQKGWRTAAKKPVLNQDLWQELLVVSKGKKIKWQVVEGHAGVTGNERADVIATSFADGEPVELFDGSSRNYEFL